LKRKISHLSGEIIKNIKNTFRVGSIQSIITISFTLLAIFAMTFIGTTLFNKFSATAEKNALISASQIMEQVNLNLEHYLRGMTEVSNLITEELNDISLQDKTEIENIFKTTLRLRRDVVTLGIFTEEGELVASTADQALKKGLNVKEQEWFNEVIMEPQRLHFSSPHVQNLFRGHHRWVVSLSREVFFKHSWGMTRGISLVDMNFSEIDELCSKVSLGKRGYIYIIDDSGNIIYHPHQQMIYAGLKNDNLNFAVNRNDGSYVSEHNNEKAFVSIKTVKSTGWKIVGISLYNEIITTRKEIYYFFVLILIFGMIIVFSLSFIISARISQPIKKLERLMKKVENGELDIYAEVQGEDEVKHLSRTFNVMIERIRQLMDQIIKEQEDKRKSELKALQAQINPHFLYNTLDSIVWMAENEENKGVITMVTALANLFRISISRGDELIFIKDEIEHARSYLIIQQIRYMDRFDFVIDVKPEVLSYKSLKILLQPIIENAIYHGIKPMVDKGEIRVTAEIIDDRICFKVMDNGAGMTPEKLEKILKKEPSSRSGSGIGIKNVHERIQLYFGMEYGLEIESELEEGTCVKLWLPKTGVKEG
jgi:two-component system sensor histidine kinase YesM